MFTGDSASLPLCVREIVSRKPKIVGISVMDANYAKCMLMAEALKQANPSLILVVGGPTPTVSYRYILENVPSVDVCVRGEGEEVFYQLLQALSLADFHVHKANLTGIQGIAYGDGDDIRVNEPAHILLKNKEVRHYLDKYPSPYLTGSLPASAAEHAGVVTARGCNQNCVYCNCSILYKNHVYTHSIDRVLEELDFIGKNSPSKSADIFDDAFTLFPKRAEKICRGIIENAIRLRLSCLTRCDQLSEGLLDLMKEAGFQMVSFSLESAVPRILRVIGKNHPPEDVPTDGLEKEIHFIKNAKEMAKYAKKIGMKVIVSIISGLPTETRAEAEETIRYLQELTFDRYNHNYLQILGGTPISRNYEKYGYRLERISKNQIRPRILRPLDLSGLRPGRLSVQENDFHQSEMDQFKILGLLTKRSIRKPFFDNAIVQADVLSKEVIGWLRNNLALGGTILQIFSGPEKFREKRDFSLKMLLDHGAPSNRLVCYHVNENDNGGSWTWSRGKYLFYEGASIEVHGSRRALSRLQTESESRAHVLAMDWTREDAAAVGHLLEQFDSVDSCLDHLMDGNSYPLFVGLCRWIGKEANCNRLETALVDRENRIRLCWGGEPLGVVPDSAEKIFENLEKLRAAQHKERGCAHCPAKENCPMCCFPNPLAVEDYCDFVKNRDVLGKAGIFRAYYTFEDYFRMMGSRDAS